MQRSAIILITFAVILATLLLQGLTLRRLIRLVGLHEDDDSTREEAAARRMMTNAVLERLEIARRRQEVPAALLTNMTEIYAYAQPHAGDGITPGQQAAYVALRRDLIKAQRNALILSRNNYAISDEVLRRLQRELDLKTAQLS
jgi:CPA1 family monovalent cation:H+ antiporter